MADTRRDSGEFYPGGRTLARPGTAAEQVAVVRWSEIQGKPDFSGVAEIGARYTQKDVKEKVNEIVKTLSGKGEQ